MALISVSVSVECRVLEVGKVCAVLGLFMCWVALKIEMAPIVDAICILRCHINLQERMNQLMLESDIEGLDVLALLKNKSGKYGVLSTINCII